MNEQIRHLISQHPDRPLVIGHRGLAWSHPENTQPSFDAAIAAGADMVELDFQVTADGALACVHDVTLKRYVPESLHDHDLPARTISSYTLAQLREFDLGAWKHPKFAGTHVMTLDEVLETYRGRGVFLLERKSGTPQQVLDVLTKHNAIEHVVLQAYDLPFLKQIHAMSPSLAIAALGEGDFTNRLDAFKATGAQAIHWGATLRRDEVASIHAAGLALWMYTLNTELTWRGAQALGIDGITTDRCDEIRGVIAK